MKNKFQIVLNSLHHTFVLKRNLVVKQNKTSKQFYENILLTKTVSILLF